ncbi:DUF6888 family protein [Nostoc sp. ChiQUE01b]|uniref:DUF6888 family protein n=1 Tax=Nostoc sp. ChiQUE01b TaxID=3075376 RepID=UPI002AD26F7D|nr:hypothetical protein [Nostoc sp. ChiQUE01b]MDZ8257489.1 hypothetical protein [Nostoc sp. ChiQUE01b]
MEPTLEQLRSFYRMSVRMSNLLRPINLVRIDERTKRIVMLVGEDNRNRSLSQWRGSYQVTQTNFADMSDTEL